MVPTAPAAPEMTMVGPPTLLGALLFIVLVVVEVKEAAVEVLEGV